MIADTMSAALKVIKAEMPADDLGLVIEAYRDWRRAIADGDTIDAEDWRLKLCAVADSLNCNHYAFLQAIGIHADGLAERVMEAQRL